jgi:hypothetical protein
MSGLPQHTLGRGHRGGKRAQQADARALLHGQIHHGAVDIQNRGVDHRARQLRRPVERVTPQHNQIHARFLKKMAVRRKLEEVDFRYRTHGRLQIIALYRIVSEVHDLHLGYDLLAIGATVFAVNTAACMMPSVLPTKRCSMVPLPIRPHLYVHSYKFRLLYGVLYHVCLHL